MEICIEHVSKKYGKHEALHDINLNIQEGMFGLLGPNGAGKTTLLRILGTLLQPSSGQITIGEYNLNKTGDRKAIRNYLGYLPQEAGFYPDLTGREFLDYMGLLKRLYDRSARRKQISELLDVVSLSSVADHKVKTYSGGMKRRLGIAQALLGDPRLLIVDEPTSGLDPEERIRLRTLLTGLAHGRIVILSTHVVEDISQTCEYVGMLNKGNVAYYGRVRDLTALARDHVWQFTVDTNYIPPADQHVIAIVPQAEGTLYRVVGPTPTGNIRNLQSVPPTLEDAYVWLHQHDSLTINQPDAATASH
jgi:ABC-type multidrug transport system, ATPase component